MSSWRDRHRYRYQTISCTVEMMEEDVAGLRAQGKIVRVKRKAIVGDLRRYELKTGRRRAVAR